MGRISAVLTAMHDGLRRDLDACLLPGGGVDLERFDRYRHTLLRHISLEEQVLMPALIAARGRPPDFRNGLRKDHAGIAALCVPAPERGGQLPIGPFVLLGEGALQLWQTAQKERVLAGSFATRVTWNLPIGLYLLAEFDGATGDG
jgi:hypothetical protein